MTFSERLQQLPSVAHLAALYISSADGLALTTLEPKPGQAGSLAIYHALGLLYSGRITPAAARLGLEWYGEHHADALAHPGKHPNIDRLLACAEGGSVLLVRAVAA
jgi:hypothetical protein